MKEYKDLYLAAQRAYTRGIQTGNGGNLSVRTETEMIVKGSGGSFADTDDQGKGFVRTTLDGVSLEEGKKPTREVFLHSLIYKICPEAGGVMHCHSPWSIAWANHADVLPMTTLHCKLKVGYDIPIFDVPSASVRPEDAPMIEAAFKENPNIRAFILKNHGIVAIGNTAVNAEHMAELIEETAQVATLTELLNK